MSDPHPYVPWYWRDWRSAKTRALLVARRNWLAGWCIRELFDAHWMFDDCTLPDDDEELAALCGVTQEEWARVRTTVLVSFPLTRDGRRQNARALRVWLRTEEIRERNSANGLKGAEKRWGPKNPLLADRDKTERRGLQLVGAIAKRLDRDPTEVLGEASGGRGKWNGSRKARLDTMSDDRLALTVGDLAEWAKELGIETEGAREAREREHVQRERNAELVGEWMPRTAELARELAAFAQDRHEPPNQAFGAFLERLHPELLAIRSNLWPNVWRELKESA